MRYNVQRSLDNRQIFVYGILTMPFALTTLAVVVVLPTFYAVDRGLGLSLVGFVFAAASFIDVLLEPIVGHLSDKTRSRFGQRRPWLVVGAPCLAASTWLLFHPMAGSGLGYLVTACALFFLSYMIFEIPYACIGLEISPHIHERSLLAASRATFQVVGALAGSLIITISAGAELALSRLALIAAAVIFLGLVLLLLFVPDRSGAVPPQRESFVSALKRVMAQKTFRRLILTFFLIQSANALFAGLAILFITQTAGDKALVGPALGIMILASAVFLPVWVYLSRRFDKKISWAISMVVSIALLLAVPLLGPGETPAILALCAIMGAVFGCDIVMPTSILADIVYVSDRSGQGRLGATFHAMKNASSKITFVIPVGIAFPLLDLAGFSSTGSNGPFQRHVLVFFFALLPAILRLGALFVCSKLRLPAKSTEGTHGPLQHV